MFRKTRFPGLEADKAILRTLLSKGERYLVASRPCGLGDVIFALAHAWLYCKKTNRSLILDLGESRYLTDPESNAATELFSFPEELEGVNIYLFPRFRWSLRKILFCKPWAQQLFLFSSRLFCYYERVQSKIEILPSTSRAPDLGQQRETHLIKSGDDLTPRFVRFKGCHSEFIGQAKPFILSVQPSHKIARMMEDFLAKLPDHFVGVHVRYYSPEWVTFRHGKYWENFDEAIEQIESRIRSAQSLIAPSGGVLLCTNDSEVENAIRSRIPDLVTLPKSYGSNPALELQDQGIPTDGVDTVIEMFALARSAVLVRFPPSKSWFSEIAAMTVPEVIE